MSLLLRFIRLVFFLGLFVIAVAIAFASWLAHDFYNEANRIASEPAEHTPAQCTGVPVTVAIGDNWMHVNPNVLCAFSIVEHDGEIEVGSPQGTKLIGTTDNGPDILDGIRPEFMRATRHYARVTYLLCDWRAPEPRLFFNTCKKF
ncbi:MULTISPECIES: hypothetical protein [unclassified Bradyrhizobium]|uniref:hypothetical protein n=1 Tax=unclassified Bradyrhizobium TaxID=2631580 RepID=UPI002915FF98|nr:MULTISPECIES: hypothetical protein [unclassified Bradyrhizobium]